MFVGRTILRCGVGALVLAAAACGVVVSIEPAPDGGSDDDAGGDVVSTSEAGTDARVDGGGDGNADGAGPCTDDMPFLLPPEALTPSFGTVTSARVAAGGAVAFLSGHGLADFSGDQIYEGPFPPVPGAFAAILDFDDDDSHPSPTPDRLRLYFEMDGGSGRAVATATRTAPSGIFGGTQIVPLGSGFQTREPYAVGDGSVLYFTREPGTIGGRDIYRAQRADGGAWTTTAVDVSSGQNEGFPVVTDDELSIYFSRASGANGEIFVAKRGSTGALWEIPTSVAGIDDPAADDRPAWISPDRCTLLFTSNRGDAGALYQLYRVRRRL